MKVRENKSEKKDEISIFANIVLMADSSVIKTVLGRAMQQNVLWVVGTVLVLHVYRTLTKMCMSLKHDFMLA